MSDYERGYYYGIYKKRVHDDQMLSQKILGFLFAVCAIFMQIIAGTIEFILVTSMIIGTGIWLILTRKNFMKGE